ncbi:MAG TPA: hypothetical protein VD837_17535 [Terriglobales bacterium]|nr:hypothetical protein [Terriglobales bacterium]
MTANRICQLRVRSTALALSVLSCIFFASCLFIPVRTPKTTAGAAGPAERGVDLTFLERGKTTRDEVLSKLAFMNTGCDSRTLFWGRGASRNGLTCGLPRQDTKVPVVAAMCGNVPT